MVFSAWLRIQEDSAWKWQFPFLPETGLMLKNVVGIFFGSAFNVYWFPSPWVWFAPLVCMVPCPGPSKKSCLHRVISGFGLGPRFDSVDLRPDTTPVALPPPPPSPPLGLKLRPVLSCPTENTKYSSKWKSQDSRSQSPTILSCCPPQHTVCSVSVTVLLFLTFPFSQCLQCICFLWSSCIVCAGLCGFTLPFALCSQCSSLRMSGPIVHTVCCDKSRLTAYYYFCGTFSFILTLVLS